MSSRKPKYFYETLSMLDYSMLIVEEPIHPMHTGALTIFKSGRMKTEGGGIDFDALRDAFEGVLHHIPRYRQKLMWQDPQQAISNLRTPGWLERLSEQPPVWVDDPDFDIHYHVRHIAVPRPGSEEQLKGIVGRLLETPLDRAKPLWEAWIIEGLQGGNFAVLIKIHHCMVDGMAGVGLAQYLLSPDPEKGAEKPKPFKPRPAPTVADLRKEDHAQKFRSSMSAMGSLGESLLKPGSWWENTERAIRSFQDVLSTNTGMTRSETPLNGEVGLHRQVEWCYTPLAEIKAIKNALGCTLNDALMVIVNGAIREYLKLHKINVKETPFRIGMPVDLRAEGDDSEGNQITMMLVELPISETRLEKQLELIRAQTGKLDKGNQAFVINTIMSVVEYVPVVMPLIAKNFAGPGNCYLTNLRGPQFPLYQVGCEMVGCFPIAPLNGAMGLCIGAMSYQDQVCWGFACDPDLVTDMTRLRELLEESVAKTLERSGAQKAPRKAAKKAPRARKASARKAPAPKVSALETPQKEGDAEPALPEG